MSGVRCRVSHNTGFVEPVIKYMSTVLECCHVESLRRVNDSWAVQWPGDQSKQTRLLSQV